MPTQPAHHPDPRLPFTAPWLLAPMEGVTDPLFRSLVLSRHIPLCLGGAFTEFVRVVGDLAVPSHVLERHLGEQRFDMPVGLQLMGSEPQALAESARRAAAAGAPLVDLNFGCPAKGALRGCAGSALLREPARVEALVAACVKALGASVPLTAKLRAGFDDDARIEELASAVEAGGAALLTLHARTKAEAYSAPAQWSRIERAVASVSIPVCGNGGVSVHADLERLRRATGAHYAMVGRAALGDPWIFSGKSVTPRDAVHFLFEYAGGMYRRGSSLRGALSRVKELLRYWTAGELVRDADDRQALLRTNGVELVLELAQRASIPVVEARQYFEAGALQTLELSGQARELGLLLR